MLEDNEGSKLETGFYIGSASYALSGVDVYFIQVDERGSSFTVETWDGYSSIIDFMKNEKIFILL